MKNQSQYISLQEATKYCSYSQEYLSLRARQGKLKAVKIGRNWVIKKEWLKEYLKRNEKEKRKERKVKVVTRPQIQTTKPPENLPIETTTEKLLIPLVELVGPKIRFRFIGALVFVLLLGGLFFFGQIKPEIFPEKIKITYQDTSLIMATMVSKEVRASTIDTFKDYGQWLRFQIPKVKTAYFAADNFVKRKLSRGYQRIAQLFKLPEKIPKEKIIPQPTEEGMVVIPYPEDEEEIKKKVKEAFSDEVKVEPKDRTSGVIIPIFREREGQRYLYIMVPMKN